MAENIHIDLTEDIEQELLSKYQGLCDELTQKLGDMAGALGEICDRTRYEPMLDAVNQTINLFYDEIHATAEQVFEEWIDGDGSFQRAAENSMAGDAALETARSIENSIRDIFDNFWSGKALGEEISLDTSRPVIKSEDFDELKDIYTKCADEVGDISESAINGVKEQGSDNPTYNIIIPAMKAITEPVKNAFEEFCKKIDEAKDKSEELKHQQASHNEEAAEAATSTSATATDIAESFNMFDGI